jgi:peptide/nickel transport system substrate-binding protein
VLPVEAYSRLEAAPSVKPVLTAPYGFPYIVLNTKQGPFANVGLRQSVEVALNNADMMGAGFGDRKVLRHRSQPLREEHAVLFDGRHRKYGKGDAKKAAALAASAKYDGTPIRILTSQQYDFHYRIAL